MDAIYRHTNLEALTRALLSQHTKNALLLLVFNITTLFSRTLAGTGPCRKPSAHRHANLSRLDTSVLVGSAKTCLTPDDR